MIAPSSSGLPLAGRTRTPRCSPSLRRMLVELALGRDVHPLGRSVAIFPPPPNTVAQRASALLGATAVLGYLKSTRAGDAPEASRLTEQIQGLVAELITLQAED